MNGDTSSPAQDSQSSKEGAAFLGVDDPKLDGGFAFQRNTVGSTIRSLGVALENTSAAESAIRDTDFAAETAELTRSQILQQAATTTLSIANSQPQSALALLG